MLVLSRHVNEKVVIGENIEVMIVKVQGDKIRLGITAPKSVRIMREELLLPPENGHEANEENE